MKYNNHLSTARKKMLKIYYNYLVALSACPKLHQTESVSPWGGGGGTHIYAQYRYVPK